MLGCVSPRVANDEMTKSADVLITGAGPTGLLMAIQLARNAIPFRIIDKVPQRSDKSRALAVHARTLEILARLGLADQLISRGTRALQGNINVDGRFVATVNFGDIGIDETPYPFILLVSQADTEQVLEAGLNQLGVSVERALTLSAFSQDEHGVTAKLEGGNGDEWLRVRYLVGADGAHSTVRHGCNLAFEGDKYSNDFLLADVDVEWDRPNGQFHFFLGWHGIVVFFPLPGDRTYRIISTRSREESGGQQPTLEEFAERVRDHCRVAARLSNPRWLSLFRLHHRGVDRCRHHNAFVAGDAAHIHSPVGGQGMNTGIQDAWNLAWKMALVLTKRAQPEILDSYHEERYPVGQKLLNFTDRLFSIIISRSWLVAMLRTYLVPAIAPFATRSRARRARLFRFVSQTAIRYRHSRLNNEAGVFRRGPKPGDRVPDLPLHRGDGAATTLHEQLDGRRYCLFVFLGEGERYSHPIESALTGFEDLVVVTFVSTGPVGTSSPTLVDRQGRAHLRFGVRQSALYLIRPDDHITFRCQGVNATALKEHLARFLLERGTETTR